jgi:hypothetical protein
MLPKSSSLGKGTPPSLRDSKTIISFIEKKQKIFSFYKRYYCFRIS